MRGLTLCPGSGSRDPSNDCFEEVPEGREFCPAHDLDAHDDYLADLAEALREEV